MGPKTRLIPLLLVVVAATLLAERNCQSAPERVEGAAAAGGLEGRPGGEYGVKLCGREFIRAVIFTCGGSRWKRISPQAPAPPPVELVQTGSDDGLENINLQSILDSNLDQLRTNSQSAHQLSLKNMFNLYDNYVPASDSFSEYIRQAKDAVPKVREEMRLANSMGLNDFPWGTQPRRKRDFSVGVAAVCCKWGCTKSEIGTLC